jgi:hypothetical protein
MGREGMGIASVGAGAMARIRAGVGRYRCAGSRIREHKSEERKEERRGTGKARNGYIRGRNRMRLGPGNEDKRGVDEREIEREREGGREGVREGVRERERESNLKRESKRERERESARNRQVLREKG